MQLRVSGSAPTDAAGRASVQLGPVPPWQVWTIDRVALSATMGDPEARLYRGAPVPANLLGGTYSGALDTYDPGTPLTLMEGQSLLVEWTRGTPGAICTALATGSK